MDWGLGYVGVRIFPEREQILTRCLGFRSVLLERISIGEVEMSEGPHVI